MGERVKEIYKGAEDERRRRWGEGEETMKKSG